MSAGDDVSPSKWIIERFTRYSVCCHAAREIVRTAKTRYQQVEIVDTFLYGRCLFLDGKLQSSEVDEFIYHESLVHPALLTHPDPRRVLIVGGGEGATLREVLRHSMVEEANMIDIDEELVGLCREWLPGLSQGAFDSPKAEVIFSDARKWLEEGSDQWDIIIIDLPEPLPGSPASLLYTRQFYSVVRSRLTDDGIVVIQAGTTHVNYTGLFASINKTLMQLFPIVRPYSTFIPSYQLPWGFSLASKRWDPVSSDLEVLARKLSERDLDQLRHYSPRCHVGMFSLPKYLEETVERDGRIIEDGNPYYWEE